MGRVKRQAALRTAAAALVTTAVAATLSVGVPAPASARVTTLDNGSRQAVTEAYRSAWAPATAAPVQISGGDPRSCTAYQTSAATQAHTKAAINFARALAGMQPVTTVNDTHAGAAGLSALLQAANRTLSHTPPSSWLCWTLGAATAAGRSNLDLRWSSADGFLPTVADIVGDYLVDRGSTNTEVGHRRWLLLPGTTTMGSGNALVTDGAGTRYVANDLWVVPSVLSGRPAGSPAFYGWPSAGWFPSPMEPEGRWSLSSSTGASFAHATVRVTHGGASVPVTVHRPVSGYGDNTLVWDLATPPPASGATPQTYDVTVRGISGGPSSTYSYTVRLFDPSWTDPSWPASTASTRVAAERTSVALHAAHHIRRHQRARLHVVVDGTGTPTGRVVVRLDGRRIGAWSLHAGARTVRLPALGRVGRHRVVVHYAGTGRWSASTRGTILNVMR